MVIKFFHSLLQSLALVFILSSGGILTGNEHPPMVDGLVVRGELVCLDRAYKEIRCSAGGNTFGLKAGDGKIYPLKTDKSVETLNVEKRLQTREFHLTLRQVKNSPAYEIIKSQFIRRGKVYDFYYYCEVCNITTYSPGRCMCCQQETEYREKLAE
jgi:hypothetical protein